MIKKFLCLIALTLAYSPYAFSAETVANEMGSSEGEAYAFNNYDSSTKNITKGQYIGGGVVSVIVGLGVGHAIQGRYMEKGWIFTTSELVAFGGYITSIVLASSSIFRDARSGSSLSNETKTWGGVGIAFLIALIGLRTWEIVDAWMLPPHYKVVKESPFQVKPLAYYNQKNMDLGLSLQYKF